MAERRDSDAALRRHDADPDAHGPWRRLHEEDVNAHTPARHAQTNVWVDRFQAPLELRVYALEGRMTTQEMWRQRLLGGFAVLSLFVGGGALALIYQLASHK
jgi:hypothetical protein